MALIQEQAMSERRALLNIAGKLDRKAVKPVQIAARKPGVHITATKNGVVREVKSKPTKAAVVLTYQHFPSNELDEDYEEALLQVAETLGGHICGYAYPESTQAIAFEFDDAKTAAKFKKRITNNPPQLCLGPEGLVVEDATRRSNQQITNLGTPVNLDGEERTNDRQTNE